MSDLADKIATNIEEIFSAKYEAVEGRTVPEVEEIALGDGVVDVEVCFLYADLANSSKLSTSFPRHTAAKIMRAYLNAATLIIGRRDGAVRSFDGDRIMGVFVGDFKCNSATRCALEIDSVVYHQLDPKAKEHFKSIREADFRITHGVGLDVSAVSVVRAGAKGTNDLVWVGRAPCLAAKLSEIRSWPYTVHASAQVYERLKEDLTVASDGSQMWGSVDTEFLDSALSVYRTAWCWKP